MYETDRARAPRGRRDHPPDRPEALNAWNHQLGPELLDAVRSVAADDERARGLRDRQRARVLLGGRPARPRRPPADARGPRRRPHDADDRLPPDPHDAAADAQAGRRGGQRSGRRDRLLAGAVLRPAALRASRRTCCWPSSTSASCPTAARSRFVSTRAGAGRAAAMALLGERVRRGRAAARRARRRGRRPTTSSRPRAARASTRSRPGRRAPTPAPSASSTRGCTPTSTAQLELEAAHPAGDGGVRGLPRGRHRVSGEARAEVLRRMTPRAATRGDPGPPADPATVGPGAGSAARSPLHEYNARRLGSRSHSNPSPRLHAHAPRGDRGHPGPRRRRLRGLLDARIGRLAAGRQHRHALQDRARRRRRRLLRRRGRAAVLDRQVPHQARRGAGPDSRQHAPGDRLDARRRRHPRGPRRRDVRDARRHPQPAQLRRRRLPHRSHRQRPERVGLPAAPAQRPRAEHRGQRTALRLALHVSRQGHEHPQQRLRVRDALRADEDDGDADDQGAGRRALVVDPRAGRQGRRRPGPPELHVVQGRRAGHVPRPVRRAVRPQPRGHDRQGRRARARRLRALDGRQAAQEIKAANEAAQERRRTESEQLEEGNSPVTEELPSGEGE